MTATHRADPVTFGDMGCRLWVAGLVLVLMGAAASADDGHPRDHLHDHGSAHTHDHGQEHSHASSGSKPGSADNGLIWSLTVGYGLVIAAASWLGGVLPRLVTLTHIRMQLLLSFVGGLMLGIAVLHMLPHALHAAAAESTDTLMLSVLAGVLLMFGLLRAFHVHVHEPPALADEAREGGVPVPEVHQHAAGESCGHAHGSGAAAASWLGAFLGLGVHTLLDGVALGAALQAEAAHADGWGLYGLGVAAAIALHKPMDSLSIATLMSTSGAAPGQRSAINWVYALLCPLGAALFHLGVSGQVAETPLLIPAALAFAAGMFLAISLSDLLPEMQLHAHNRCQLSLALLLGVAAAWAIGFLEPAHLHGH